jgi:hypothetical protein
MIDLERNVTWVGAYRHPITIPQSCWSDESELAVNNLVRAAVRGTRQYNMESCANQLKRLSGGLQFEKPESQLLLHFGMCDIERRAGYVPDKMPVIEAVTAPPETTPVCDVQALSQLHWLMQGALWGMMPVWIDKFTERELRLPPEWLSFFLQENTDYIYTISVLMPLLGERGRWFIEAAECPEWQPLLKQEPTDDYDNILRISSDHDTLINLRLENPQQGLAWLEERWSSFDFHWKYWFVDALQYGLGAYDEAFLWERLLEDSNENYRDDMACIAARLLTQLPQTERGQWLIETAANAAILSHEFQEPIFDFRWSQKFSDLPTYQTQDCITPLQEKFSGTLSLMNVVHFVPLDYWCQQWDCTPFELIDAALRGGHANAFISGWYWRTLQEKHAEFAHALLLREQGVRSHLVWSTDYLELCRLIAWDDYQALMTKWLQAYKERLQ